MTEQLESNHFFRTGDVVRHTNGEVGTVIEAWTLYAVILWGGGDRDEVDQFDPMITIVERARAG